MGNRLIMRYRGYRAVCEFKDGHVVATVPEFEGTFAIVAATTEDVKEVFKRYVKLDRKRKEKAALQNRTES